MIPLEEKLPRKSLEIWVARIKELRGELDDEELREKMNQL